MKITRHNYEEYFILYMDNELSSEKRRMVELFIEKNPDLKAELELLMHFKMVPDNNIVFEGKEELLKDNSSPVISFDNSEEWSLLYIDNELTKDQKTVFETFIAGNPAAQKELDLFRKSKLTAENIVFNYKESLFRKEEKTRIIPIKWWRAAAAILVFALGLTTFIVINNKRSVTKDDIVKITEPGKTSPEKLPEQKDRNNPLVTNEEQNIQANNTVKVEKDDALIPEYKQSRNAITVKNNSPVDNKVPVNIPAPVKNELPLIAENKPSNNLPQPISNPNVITNAVAINSTPSDKNPINNSLTNPEVTSGNTQPSDIVTASFNDNERGSKKTKLRGLFRKVTRTFEKRTNIEATDGENRLLIAGLAFKMN